MNNLKERFLAKIDKKGNKKSIENLVVFVIILIATVIFINYIWNGDKKNGKSEQENPMLADTIVDQTLETTYSGSSAIINKNGLEKQIENILKKLEGVEDISVLITYEETNKVIPMYNEDVQASVTQEEDTQGRC